MVNEYEQYIDSKIEEILIKSDHYNSVTIITPTIGKESLNDAILSVSKQNYKNITHLIVVDGEMFIDDVNKIVANYPNSNIKIVILPFNTGKNGFNGHRIYATMPFLINSKYIMFLDEDNWYDDNHVVSMIDSIESEDLDWVYSMRKIFNHKKIFITDDNCESIGEFNPYSKMPPLVDTNCYLFKRKILVKVAQFWYHPLKADRVFFNIISNYYKKFKCTQEYTVNYRLTKDRPPSADFFIKGNNYMLKKHKNKLPWLKVK